MADAGSVIVRLLADIREFKAKMAEGQGLIKEFGASADTMGARLNSVAQKASTGLILGIGGALVYGVKKAYDFQESLDKIQNQSGATKAEVDRLSSAIISTSNATGKTTSEVANSALIIEQAGIRGAKAISLMDASAKASVVTGTDLTSVTKSLIAVQNLQIAKGMKINDLTGILVAGSKDFVGGLSAEESMLTGRVGAALANYGLSLKNIIGIGAEFSRVGLPTRAVLSFVNSMSNLDKSAVDSKGKLTPYALALKQLGLNQTELAAMSKRGDIVGILKAINEQAIRGGQPLKDYVEAVFGKAGAPSASALIKNLTAISQVQKDINGAGSQSFAAIFSNVSKQLGPQLTILKTQLSNTLLEAGKAILPTVATIVNWIGDFAKAINDHPLLKDTLGTGLAAAFLASVAIKAKSAFKAVGDLFGLGKNTPQVVATGANTDALIANTDALLGKTGTSLVTDTAAAGNMAEGSWKFGPYLTVALAAAGLMYAGSQGKSWAQMTPQQKLTDRSPNAMFGQTGWQGTTNTVVIKHKKG